jgi:8-oxo-dGTP diphosphatase
MAEVAVEQKHMVSVIPYNARGEALLQQRDNAPGILYPGHWTIFGGAVEPEDESYDAAIRRELWEELELDLPVRAWHTYTCPVRSIPGKLEVIVHVYVAPTDRPVESLTLREGQALGYFDRDGAARLNIGFMKAPVLERFFDDLEGGRL